MKKLLSVATNTLYQFLSRLSTGLVTILLTPLLTNYLGLSGYGQYQMILGFVTLFWILTDFGLNAVVVKEMTQNDDRTQSLFSSLLTLRLINGVVVSFIAPGLGLLLPYPWIVKLGIIIASLTIFSQSLMGTGGALFQAKTRFKNTFYSTAVGSVSLLLLTIVLIRMKAGLLTLIIAYTLSYLLMMTASLVLSKKWVSLVFDKSLSRVLPIFKRSLPFGVALLLSLGAFKIDSILMAILPISTGLKNSDAVAIYSLPYRMFELTLALPTFLMNVLYPLLIKKFQEDFLEFGSTVRKILLSMTGVSILGIGATWVLAPFFINLLARTVGFGDSIIILKILILSYPLFFYSNLLMWIVMIIERQRDLIWVYGAAFVFNFIANLWLIPKYFYWAASWTTIATEGLILGLLGVVLLVRKSRTQTFPDTLIH